MRRRKAAPAPANPSINRASGSKLPPPVCPPELVEEDDELDELELLELDDDEELLELEDEVEPPKIDARSEVSRMPLAPLIRRSPQLVRLLALKLLTISSVVQQDPLPDQDQPI